MPLVVPGIMSNNDKNNNNNDASSSSSNNGKNSQWLNQLMGKKIGDTSDTMTFAKKDLPKEHRIIRPGDMSTTDHNPNRLNVHLAEDGTVADVKHG